MSTRARAAGWVSVQGHYAGSVSRLLAFIIDAAVSGGLFALGLSITSLAVQVVTGHSVSWNKTNIVVAIILGVWEFFYFAYSWAMSGRTFGMAVLGIRVVRTDGKILDPWRGLVRALAFPLSFLFFGLGFLGILIQREHRALHDLIAGTAVIYAWDARAARLRFLARDAEVGAIASPQRLAVGASGDGASGAGPAAEPTGNESSDGASGAGPAAPPTGNESSDGASGAGPAVPPAGNESSDGASGTGPADPPARVMPPASQSGS